MPFVTEELWQRLPKAEGPQPPSIMTAPFPTLQERWKSAAVEETMESLLEVVRATRGLRAGGLTGYACLPLSSSHVYAWFGYKPRLRMTACLQVFTFGDAWQSGPNATPTGCNARTLCLCCPNMIAVC